MQAVIPITLLISASLLGKSYGRLHWIAAAAVTAGVVASQRFGGPITTSLQWGWAWALLVSRVPAAAANVLSEAVLAPPGPTPRAWPQLRSVLRATFWTGLFALPLNLPSNLAVSALRGLPPLHAVRDDYSAGALCLLRETGCSGAAAAVLAFAVLLLLKWYPAEVPSTNLDTDWFYRVPGRAFIGWAAGASRATWNAFWRLFSGQVEGIMGRIYAAHGPEGQLSRSWPIGFMALWTAVVLGLVLILSFLA